MPTWLVSLPDRLDSFLSHEGRMISRSKAQRAIETGLVLVNGAKSTKASARLQEGDLVSLEGTAEPALSNIEPVSMDLPILYEDAACFVIDKPAGFAVHPGAGTRGETTILNGLRFILNERGLPFSEADVLVHRLDRETTGCLLVAKDPASHIALQKQFSERSVAKTYLALVVGIPEHENAMIDAPIGRNAHNRTTMSVLGATAVRDAQTSYRILARAEHAALLACDLHTGRTHQIRVHLSAIGHPILGDSTYTNALSERLTQEYAIPSLCLHAWKLSFHSPKANKRCSISAPLPRIFSEVLEQLGIKIPR